MAISKVFKAKFGLGGRRRRQRRARARHNENMRKRELSHLRTYDAREVEVRFRGTPILGLEIKDCAFVEDVS